MAKEQRATDKMNLALSGIEAAATISKHVLEDLPDDTKKRILIALDQIETSTKEARDALHTIRKAAETI